MKILSAVKAYGLMDYIKTLYLKTRDISSNLASSPELGTTLHIFKEHQSIYQNGDLVKS